MGPLRRGLILALLPGAALAEVCDKERPLWDGPSHASMLDEALNLFLSPAGVILLVLSMAALRFRNQWIGLATVLLWTVFVTMVTMTDPTGVRLQAMTEGCIASPTLFIVAVAAICVGIVLYTKPRTSGADGSES
ncbi:hypothetical protein [uncultured Tateyamaria sp.]|uniref:hypothetical protein n=1 Tax=uncultured Tateyamaria sp. TaxID=455651 RepID=UPI002608117D|nr:hypothetical protein [uncultured Tateyamaria sp.]